MNIIDLHTHTKNSPDGSDTVEAMVEKAKTLGLSAYAITDHCEVNRFYPLEHYGDIQPKEYDTYDFEKDFYISMEENTAIKERLGNCFKFLCGIELGQAPYDYSIADKVVSDKRLDFVIGSIHQIIGEDDFAFISYENADTIPQLLEKYYTEVLELSRWNKFDVLGHLTYPLRYIVGNSGIPVDMKPYEELIAESFKTLISNGKGIEINTSGLRQKYGKTFPDLSYLKLYKDLGGEILTIGSDAHCTADLGKGVKEGSELAQAAGFKRICYFEERKPVFVEI